MNFENSKTSNLHKILKWNDKHIALSILSICYTWKNIIKSCKNNKFKISALTWNNKGKQNRNYISTK